MNLGIFVHHLSPSQLAFFSILETNKLVKTRSDISPLFFTLEHSIPCARMETAVFNQSELWGYKGKIIATSLQTAHQLLQIPGNFERYFYVWDLGFLRIPEFMFSDMVNIYNNPNIKIITRCENHKMILENNFGAKSIGIAENFNMNKILELIGEKCQI